MNLLMNVYLIQYPNRNFSNHTKTVSICRVNESKSISTQPSIADGATKGMSDSLFKTAFKTTEKVLFAEKN